MKKLNSYISNSQKIFLALYLLWPLQERITWDQIYSLAHAVSLWFRQELGPDHEKFMCNYVHKLVARNMLKMRRSPNNELVVTFELTFKGDAVMLKAMRKADAIMQKHSNAIISSQHIWNQYRRISAEEAALHAISKVKFETIADLRKLILKAELGHISATLAIFTEVERLAGLHPLSIMTKIASFAP